MSNNSQIVMTFSTTDEDQTHVRYDLAFGDDVPEDMQEEVAMVLNGIRTIMNCDREAIYKAAEMFAMGVMEGSESDPDEVDEQGEEQSQEPVEAKVLDMKGRVLN